MLPNPIILISVREELVILILVKVLPTTNVVFTIIEGIVELINSLKVVMSGNEVTVVGISMLSGFDFKDFIDEERDVSHL